MKFKLEIECDNAAFADDNRHYEVARILREAADTIEQGDIDTKLRDINGNTVGIAKFTSR